jgi:hypothetical protein
MTHRVTKKNALDGSVKSGALKINNFIPKQLPGVLKINGSEDSIEDLL